MVLVRIARMLRGWLVLYKKEDGEYLEGDRQTGGGVKAPGAQIEWREEVSTASSSQLVPLGVQSSVDARSDLFTAEFCNEPLG